MDKSILFGGWWWFVGYCGEYCVEYIYCVFSKGKVGYI